MDDWKEATTAVAAIGTLIVAVIALSSRFVSRAIDKQGALLDKHEKKNAGEHADLGKRIDQVDEKITELNRKVDSGFDKVNQTLQTLNGSMGELIGRFKERDNNKAADKGPPNATK